MIVRQKILPWENVSFTRPKRHRVKFNRTFPRDGHADKPSDEERDICDSQIYDSCYINDTYKTLAGADTIRGVEELFRCRSHNAVASLMSTGVRGAYNFENYHDCSKDKDCKNPKQTVEFRQAAGSLDGGWVATYARICVGIAWFAKTATKGRFWRLVYDCQRAEVDKTRYDILDLLLDLSLAEEAKVVQQRLETGSHVAEVLRPFSSKTGRTTYSS
ncbi:hypothetical protein F5Y05DRAFT_425128 [Hypoxylon sp. FL0543]|nr:hypothetical protein F5Y05DRAFT_425128 [Hypoxylon sp. FL0543]